MAIIVQGRNVEVTPAMKAHVEKKIQKITKQFKAVGDIKAVLKVEKRGEHVAEITVPAKGFILRAQEQSDDMYACIDSAIDKIERQVHKYKTRMMRRKYNNFRDVEEIPVEAPAEEFEVVKSKSFALHPMNVEEAILQMNLLNHDFFVYYDPDFGGVCVVYKRDDGRYGVLKPSLQ